MSNHNELLAWIHVLVMYCIRRHFEHTQIQLIGKIVCWKTVTIMLCWCRSEISSKRVEVKKYKQILSCSISSENTAWRRLIAHHVINNTINKKQSFSKYNLAMDQIVIACMCVCHKPQVFHWLLQWRWYWTTFAWDMIWSWRPWDANIPLGLGSPLGLLVTSWVTHDSSVITSQWLLKFLSTIADPLAAVVEMRVVDIVGLMVKPVCLT